MNGCQAAQQYPKLSVRLLFSSYFLVNIYIYTKLTVDFFHLEYSCPEDQKEVFLGFYGLYLTKEKKGGGENFKPVHLQNTKEKYFLKTNKN